MASLLSFEARHALNLRFVKVGCEHVTMKSEYGRVRRVVNANHGYAQPVVSEGFYVTL